HPHSLPLHSFPTRRSSDLSALPDSRDFAKINIPVPVLRTLANQIHSLCIGANLRGIQRIVNCRDHSLFVAGELWTIRPFDLFTGDRRSTRLNSSHLGISYA